jgi:RNA polymerase sigma-70 factor, ECF subfamily
LTFALLAARMYPTVKYALGYVRPAHVSPSWRDAAGAPRRTPAGARGDGGMSAAADPGAASFEAHPRALIGLAYRMLGSRAEAEDAVQDAYLRWHATDRVAIAEPRRYLGTVVTRLCIDRLQSARARRELYVGPWLPEPVVD